MSAPMTAGDLTLALPELGDRVPGGMVASAFVAFLYHGACPDEAFGRDGFTAEEIAQHGATARANGLLLWRQDQGGTQ